MKKGLLKALVDSYDRKPPGGGYPFFPELQKGFIKYHGGWRTKGMDELAKHLENLQDLKDSDVLTMAQICSLAFLIDERHKRTLGTSRDDLKQPQKATNRVYNIIEAQLWMYVHNLKDTNETSEITYLKERLFSHKKDYLFKELKEEFETYELDKKAEQYRVLGMAMCQGGVYNASEIFHTRKSDISKDPSVKHYVLKLNESNKMSALIKFMEEEGDIIENAEISISEIKFDATHYSVKGLKYLHKAAELGSAEAAFTLAQVYARDHAIIILDKVDTYKATEYLKISSKLGVEKATTVLQDGGKFGEVDIEPERGLFDRITAKFVS